VGEGVAAVGEDLEGIAEEGMDMEECEKVL